MATLPRKHTGKLNRIIIQSPEIQRIIDGLQHSDAAICVIDRESKGKQILKENDIELVSLLTKTDLDNAKGE